MNSRANRLHIILPCYKPPAQWSENLCARLGTFIVQVNRPVRVILVNDGPDDALNPKDIKLLETCFTDFVYISHGTNKGKGQAVRTGLASSEGAAYLYTDIDLPYSIESMRSVVRQVDEGADIVAATKDPEYYSQVPWLRKQISLLLRWCIRQILSIPFSDTQCGLKACKAKGRNLLLNTHIMGYLFDLEWIVQASKEKEVKIATIPARLRSGVEFSQVPLPLLLKEFINFLKIYFS